MELGLPNTEGSQEISNFPNSYPQENFLAPTKKYLRVVGGVYTMQTMDTNTEYQKVVRVGDQMGKIVKITVRIIFL